MFLTKDEIGNIFDFISEKNMVEEVCYDCQGEYPLYTGQTEDDGVMAFIDTYELEGECLTFTTYGVNAGELNYRNGRFTIGRNCMGLMLKDKYSDKVNLEWFAFKYQNLFWRTRIGDLSGQRSLNKLLLNNISVNIPDIKIQLKELASYKRAYELKHKINDIVNMISLLENTKVELLESIYEESIGEIFKISGGDSGLTEFFVYHNQPEDIEDSVLIHSGATLERKKMGVISKHAILPKGNRIKIFEGEGIIVSRNGYYAGSMQIVGKNVDVALNDHAYFMKLKKKWIGKVNITWFVKAYQELFFNLVSSKSDNATFNKTYAEKQMVSIPSYEFQEHIAYEVEKLAKLKQELSICSRELLSLLEFEILD